MPKLTQKNFRNHDPDDMFGAIAGFSEQITQALEISAAGVQVPKGRTKRVVVVGMGGSAIGGDMLRSYITGFDDHNGVDIRVSRDYVPPSVSRSDLLVASSYSGNTEETLDAYNGARKAAGNVFVLTTGGKLARSARGAGYRMLTLPAGLQPRAALGYSFFPLLHTLAVRTRLFGDKVAAETEVGIDETVRLMAKLTKEYSVGPIAGNPAWDIARAIHGKVPVIYSATERLDTVNVRWRGQIQENAKHLAFGSLLPEMNHNEINGWSHPARLTRNFAAIYLRDKEDHTRVKRRIEITREIIARSAGETIDVKSRGRSRLARIFSLVHLGDWVSYYLSSLTGADPSPVPVIEDLKGRLKRG